MDVPAAAAAEQLRRAGAEAGDLVALVAAPGVGLGLAWARPAGRTSGDAVEPGEAWAAGTGGRAPGEAAVPVEPTVVTVAADDPAPVVRAVEEALAPRWVMWSGETALTLVRAGVRVARSWDLAAVHRLLAGGWRADPGRVWAVLQGLPVDEAPVAGPLDLFTHAQQPDGRTEGPLRADGHVDADWAAGGWAGDTRRLGAWAALAIEAARLQSDALARLDDPTLAAATARSESAAELLCAEMSVDGLPLDRAAAEAIVAGFVGPRPRTAGEAAQLRDRRDAEVLRHAPPGPPVDLRSPGQVKSLLRRVGVEVPDTRAWRLEAVRDTRPLVDALLTWRKAERVATTYGYRWLDEHLDADGRLRGEWSGSDGAAGRMTASAGLHNMPADMRGAVAAGEGHVFVRADLGQIEPRVLAAVSGDAALARAAGGTDMYAPVAAQLGVDRATAKVAVLGAMYGQTTGHGASALRRLRSAYPTAMAVLDDADRAGQAGRDLRTYGGRLIRLGRGDESALGEADARRRAGARGRYARNALIQGAAAELFKVWAALVRSRGSACGARIVLCLHDELLVHAPADQGAAVAGVVEDCLQEAAARWAPGTPVRFVVDVAVVDRWADAKP
jgi:DNA polymerase-1